MARVAKQDLDSFARQLIDSVGRQEKSGTKAPVIALVGDLGAGKTTFVQALARVLGIEEPVRSPTFVLEQVYQLPEDTPFRRLVHIDAYRLESAEELEHLGWQELMVDPQNLIVVEWADRVAEIIPEDAVWLQFELAGEEDRRDIFQI